MSKMENLSVADEPLDSGKIEFLGTLKDVYQRTLLTEVIEAQIGE